MRPLKPLAEAAWLEGLHGEEFRPMVDALTIFPNLGRILTNPFVTDKEKKDLLAPLQLSPKATKVVLLLARRPRSRDVEDLIEALERRSIEAQGGVLGKVFSARPLEQTDIHRLEQATARRIGRKFVVLEPEVCPELGGGFRITVDGLTYDWTLAGTLRDLASHLREE